MLLLRSMEMGINRIKRIQILLCLLGSGLFASAQSFEDLSFGTDSTFEVMTWNIEWFPKNGSTTIDYVTQIIEALDIDLLAIQEVKDISAFEQLIDGLSVYEGYLESSYFAGLAYIYKTDVIQINDIYEIYTSSPYWSPFPRSPMVMDLNFSGERIIVINNHFKCCGNGILDLENQKDEESRRYIAANLLKDYIDEYFPNENTIVLGDLNDILSDNSENNVFQMFLDDQKNYLFADFEIAMDDASVWSYPTWPSHIDHILITNELFDEFENKNSVIQTIRLEEYISGGWWKYDENISDHRPLAMKLLMNPGLSNTGFTIATPHFTNYPNPLQSETTFSFNIPDGNRAIQIINIQGQRILSEKIPKGETSFTWNAGGLPDGMYVAKLILDNKVVATLKLILNK